MKDYLLRGYAVHQQTMANIKSRLPQVVKNDGSLNVGMIMNDSFLRFALMKEYNKEFKGRNDNLYTLVVESKPADGGTGLGEHRARQRGRGGQKDRAIGLYGQWR